MLKNFKFLLLVGIILLSGTAAKKPRKSSNSVSRPKKCLKDDSWFSEKKEYQYTYTGVVQSAITGTTDSRSGFMFTCNLSVTSPRKCEMVLKVKKCSLKERAPSPSNPDNPFEEIGESKIFSQKMAKNKVYFQMQDGLIIENTIITDDSETLDVTNVKRGMLSALQVQKLSKDMFGKPATINDIYGSCPTVFEKTEDKNIFHSRRDLTSCSYPEIFKKQFRVYSMIKELSGGFMKKNYTEAIYPFESLIDCDYKRSNNQLDMVKCFHHQAMIPLTYNGSIKAGAMTNISQVLELDGVSNHRSKKVDRSLKDRHLVKLEYDFGTEEKVVVDMDKVFNQLRELSSMIIGNKMTWLPGAFSDFVNMLRDSTQAQLKAVYDKVRGTPETKFHFGEQQKAVMDKFMADGLLSCGTPACISEVARHLMESQIDSFGVTAFLFDLTLNHAGALDSTLLHVLGICKTRKTGHCLLLLSGMTRTYAAKQEKDVLQKEDGAVHQVILYLREQLGESCKPGIVNQVNPARKLEQQDKMLTALKSLGNIGHFVQVAFDETASKSRQLVPALLNCAKSRELPELVVKSAILALQKMHMSDGSRADLFDIVEDMGRPLVIRTSAFAVLVRDEHRTTHKRILHVLKEEKNLHMRSYILSSLVNIMESQDPRFRRLQEMWKKLVSEQKDKLPELEYFLYRKTRYAELSRHVVIPLINKDIGGQLEFSIVYDPSSFLPRSFMFNFSVNAMGNLHNVLEIGTDMAGFETLAHSMFGEKGTMPSMSIMQMIKFMGSGQNLTSIQMAMKAREQMAAAMKAGAARGIPPGLVGKIPSGYKLPPGVNIPPGVSIPKGASGKIPQGLQTLTGPAPPGGMPQIPPSMLSLMKLMKKPNMSYVDDDVESKFKKIFDDINYPRLNMPSGHTYIKFMGNELAFVTLDQIVTKIQSLRTSTGLNDLFNLQKLMEKLAKGENFVSGHFAKFLDLHKTIPTLLGVPLRLSVHGSRAVLFDGNVQANIRGIFAKAQPVHGKGTVRARGAHALFGQMLVSLPTSEYATGLKMNLTGVLNFSFSGGLSFAEKELKLYRDNIRGPTTLFSINGNLHLVHMKEEELIAGSPDHTVRVNKCSPPKVQTLTGRVLCWTASYQNATGSDSHPHFPLTGPVSGKLTIDLADKQLFRNTITAKLEYKPQPVPGDSDKKAQHIIRLTSIAYEAPGETLKRYVSAEFKRNLNNSDIEMSLSIPELDNTVYAFSYIGMKPGKPGQPADKEILTQTMFETIKHYHSGQKMRSPVSHTTVNINMAIPNVSLDIRVNHIRSRAAADIKTTMKIGYFCSRQDSLLYLLHPDPKEAANNHFRSDVEITNSATFELTGLMDWKANDVMNIIYTKQNITMINDMWSENNRKLVYRDTVITWLNKDQEQEKVIMNSHAENKSSSEMLYKFALNMDRVGKYKVDLSGKLQGTLADLATHVDIKYKKTQTEKRSKRSWDGVASTFRHYEDKLVQAAEFLGKAFVATADEDSDDPESDDMMADKPIVSLWDRDEWTINTKFQMYRHAMMAGPGETIWSANVTYPRAGTYHDIKLRGHHIRGIDPLSGGMRFKIASGFDSSYLDKQVYAKIEFQHSPGKLYVGRIWEIKHLTSGEKFRGLNQSLTYIRGNEFSYYRDLMSPMINATMDISYVRSLADASAQLRMMSNVKSDWALLNHDYQSMTAILSTQMNTTASFTGAFGSLKAKGLLKWGLPNQGISYTLDHDWKGKVPMMPSRITNMKFSYSNKTLPSLKIVSNRPDIKKTTVVNANLLSPTEFAVKVLSQKPGDEEPVEDLTWKMTLVTHDRIQNDVNWRPAFGKMMFERRRAQVNRTFIMVTDALAMSMSNFKKNFTDREIPFINQTWGDLREKYFVPKWTKFIRHMDDYKLPTMEKSMGQMIVFIRNRLMVYHQQLKERLWNTFPGYLIRYSELDKKLLYLVSERIPARLKAWQKERPAMIRTLYARKVKPLIEKRLRDAKTSFNLSHPFVWEKFTSLPRLSHTYKAIITRMSRNLPRLGRRQWAWKGYPFHGMLFGNEYVRTFDGQIYRAPLYKDKKCYYLLAADFKDGKFVLVSNHDSITHMGMGLTLTLDNKCKVYINQSSDAIDLPWSSWDNAAQAILEDSEVQVSLEKWGIKLSCDLTNFVTRIDLAALQYNHSLGLLGTSTQEPSDDFRLPDGKGTDNLHKFLNMYELSGASNCLHGMEEYAPPSTDQSSLCNRSPQKECAEYFQSPTSTLKSCFLFVNPKSFKTSCDIETRQCDTDNPSEAACKMATAYLNLCRQKGIDVKTSCGTCGRKSLHETWREDVRDKTADVVFVISSHKDMTSKEAALKDYVIDLVKKLKFPHAQFGLVTYGDEAKNGLPTVHTLGGELFGSEEQFRNAVEKISTNSDANFPAFSAIKKAASYRFRLHSHRIIFLLTESNLKSVPSSIQLLPLIAQLKNNSITLNIVSRYQPLSGGRILGLQHDGHTVMLSGKSQTIPLPQNDYGWLVKASKGTIFHLEKIQSAGRKMLRHFHKYVHDQVTSGNDGMCRECGCYPGQAGDGVTMCRTIPC